MMQKHENADENLESTSFPPHKKLEILPEKSTISLAKFMAWSLFCLGMGIIFFSFFSPSLLDKFYPEIFVTARDHTTVALPNQQTNPANVQEILDSLGESYSPNLLAIYTDLHASQAIPPENAPQESPIRKPYKKAREKSKEKQQVVGDQLNIISPPPTAELVQQKVKALATRPAKTASNPPFETNSAPAQANLIKANPTQTNSIPATRGPKTAPLKADLKLEDLIFGMNWQSARSDLQNHTAICVFVAENIEACRLNTAGWLPHTRHIIGLFDHKNDGRLLAVQIDSIVFDNSAQMVESFEQTAIIINNRIPAKNTENIIKNQNLVAPAEDILMTLVADKNRRHYRQWSLAPLQIPAEIDSSINALSDTTGFHRTLIIQPKNHPR